MTVKINTSKQAIEESLKQSRNVVGTCQKTVRTWFNAPTAGDQDGDGDADAVDGWKSEPERYKHRGDRNPPPGVPLAFSGGSRGFGHRAMTGALPGRVRSTDMLNNRYAPGRTSTVTGTSTSVAIAQIESSMGVHYEGWSETIDGFKIPKKDPNAPKNTSRGTKVDKAVEDATALVKDIKASAKISKTPDRTKYLNLAAKQAEAALANLKKIPFIK